MKYRFVVLIAFSLSICTLSRAQDSTKAQLLDLRTPPSPAFVLLGIEPTSIDKPTEPRAVAASFISTVRQGGALEVAPYWLMSHPMLKFKDYYEADIGQTILQTLSVSFATMPRSDNTDSLGTRVGLGVRWMFAAGDPRDSLKILHDNLINVQNRMLDTDDSTKLAQFNKEAKKIALAIQRENKMRVGFRLEMATAFTMNFFNDDFSKGTFDRWGLWLTGAYLFDKPSVDFLAVARLMGNHKQNGTQNVFDLGARLVTLMKDFSISIEYIHRAEISTSGTTQVAGGTNGTFFLKSTYRLAGNIEYMYNKDISTYLTFGRNYASANTNNKPLVAQVGINFGFGRIPLINP
jgi:hypothetical protein